MDAAAAIVADAFGPGVGLQSMVELTEGWFNAAHVLELTDGRRVVLKVAPPPHVEVLTYERDIVHAELAAMQLIGSATQAPIADVLWADDRCRRLPSPLFVMTWLPGVSLAGARDRVPAEVRVAIDRTLGTHLRAINAIEGSSFGLLAPGSSCHGSWRAAFGELFEALLADGERAGVQLPISLDDARVALAASADALDEVRVPRLVDWDLWDGNVLVDPDTFEVTGLIDFERSLWGDPLMEVQFVGAGPSRAFVDAYGTGAPATAVELQRRALYTLYLHLVMSIEGTYRRYPTDPLGERARRSLADDVAAVLRAGSAH
jgi:aminoglycoside phosphotransferase (APT) family kinase protein